MQKIWNALRYGDMETRKCVGGVILFSVIGIALIVASGLLGQFGLFIIGMIAGVIAVILSQTFTLVDEDLDEEDGDASPSVTVKKNTAMYSSSTATSRKMNKEPKDKEVVEGTIEEDAKDKKEKKKKPVGGTKIEAEEEESEKQTQQPQTYQQYSEQVLKRVKRKYHVRRDHRPILVDYSKSYGIKECPAFIWRTHSKVYLLLLEKEPRRISVPRELVSCMKYEPNVRADRSKEYKAFEEDNLVTSVFEGFIPDYFNSKAQNANLKYKNLYTIYPDIRISNRSAAEVMDLLYLDFKPDDKITQSPKLNDYFKRIYALHIMYQDKVYSITEYKEGVEQVLGELSYSSLNEQEFESTLNNLVKGRMISQEYANHYREIRRKNNRKMVEVTSKK